jgi:alkyl hydroperoxide reductase subunit AhpC
LAWRKTAREQGGLGHIEIPLVADITKDISRQYGVLVENAEDPLNGATLRGLFIIDGKGKIRSITINDEQVGRNADETLRTIRAFQHADENGVVCPAGWKPGAKTIIPDQDKSK